MKKIYTPVIPDLTSYTVEKVAPRLSEKGNWSDEKRAYVLVTAPRSEVLQESKNALTKDVFDTVCSFNNRNGGHILLGVNDKRQIVGVSKDKVDKVIKELTTAINNPQKM